MVATEIGGARIPYFKVDARDFKNLRKKSGANPVFDLLPVSKEDKRFLSLLSCVWSFYSVVCGLLGGGRKPFPVASALLSCLCLILSSCLVLLFFL
jgi:hypothetical protein